MKYILLVLVSILPYLLFPLGILTAVLVIRHFLIKGCDNPAKKRISTLNAIMITSVGITIYRAVKDYIYLNILRPDLYAITSFPWYTNSLLYGAVTLVVLLVCLVIKTSIKRKTT